MSSFSTQEKDEARMQMWASLLGEEYILADKNKKKKMKKEYSKMRNCLPSTITLDCYQAVTDVPVGALYKQYVHQVCPKETKKEQNMYVQQDMTVKERTTEDNRIEHFLNHLDEVWSDKETKLREKYGLMYASPRSPKEMVEWIKAGEFTFTKQAEEAGDDWNCWDTLTSGIHWTKIKKDEKGYKEAYKALNAQRAEYQDLIWAETDSSKYPEIVKQFEKEKLH